MKEQLKKIGKVFLATLGAVNAVVGMFIPIAITLLLVITLDLTSFSVNALLVAGMLSSLFRAIRIALDI